MHLDIKLCEGANRPTRNVDPLETAKLPRHRWYFFKEAFAPQIVTQALEETELEHRDLVLDPFSGGGTVALTAATQGYRSVGLEVNPFLAFISKTKTLQCESGRFERQVVSVVKGIEKGKVSRLEGFSTFCERKGAEKWLFNRAVLRGFEGGWSMTDSMPPGEADLVRLCLIGAAMDVCNAEKDGKCLRYRREWREKRFGREELIAALQRRGQEMASDLESSPLKGAKVDIRLADSRDLSGANTDGRKFRLCVMSPPYLNSFDYTDVYRPELFLGKFVSTMAELRELRHRTVRSHVQTCWTTPTEDSFGSYFAETMREIEARVDHLWNRRIPAMIKAYFEDLGKVLRALRSLSSKDASVWMVVSTSAYAGIEIPVDLILADIGSRAGWYLREVSVVRYLRRVPVQQWRQLAEAAHEKNRRNERLHEGPHLRESLVILDAMNRSR